MPHKHIILLLLLMLIASCETAYYNTWEKFGIEKRDILVDRVENARDAQEDAQQQFSSALEEFSSLIEFDGGNLEKAYNRLNNEYRDSVDAASKVSDRIQSIDAVAKALFKEWEAEIEQYANPRFKADSQQKLLQTQRNYNGLQRSLRTAEKSMQPVLSGMQDNVLYLKHNLNARAIGALKGEFQSIKRDINDLLTEMNTAISRSNQFIADMQQ